MSAGELINLGYFVFLCLFVSGVMVAFVYQRRRWRRNVRRRKPYPGFYPTTASLGYSWKFLESFLQPQFSYLLQAEQAGDAERDDDDGEEDPDILFQRQLRRIRNGEVLDSLIVRKR